MKTQTKILTDFKEFIARGNILDLSIAVVLGAAFSSIIKTLTDGIIMPVFGVLTGGVDFKQKVWNMGEMPVATSEQIAAAQAAKQPLIMYGQLINDIITFLIVALAMFFLARYGVKLFNALKAAPPNQEILLTEIRDILRNSRQSAEDSQQ